MNRSRLFGQLRSTIWRIIWVTIVLFVESLLYLTMHYRWPDISQVRVLASGFAATAAVCLVIILAYAIRAFSLVCRSSAPSSYPVGHCQGCGYDLSGQIKSGACPECGEPYLK